MKDSKIEWVGEIPENWEVSKLKNLFSTEGGNGFNIELQGEENGDYPFCKASDISVAQKDLKKAQNYVTKQIAILNRYNIIPQGSIIFAKIGEAMKKNNRAICQCDCCIDNNCQALIPSSKIYTIFAYYILRCINMQWFDNAGTIPCISVRKMMNCTIPLPSFSEQKEIAEYLDEKCGEIDALLADIKDEIETLEQYKRSVITESVTKGLNPSAPMKNSGIEWVGEIPEHWEVKRIAAFYRLRNNKVSDKDFAALSVTKQGVLPQLETVAKTDDGDNRKLVRIGDFVINSRSDRRGSCGISNYDGSVSLINIVLEPRSVASNKYYNWLFHTEQFADEFYKWGNGIVDDLWTTRWQNMKRITIPVPPLSEQQEIAEYLDKKCAEIDEVISDKQTEIQTLESYKKSLIYEYVTGKKEVKSDVSGD